MQAKKLDAKLPLPHYALAQLSLLYPDSFKASINLLETALQQVPGWQEPLQVYVMMVHQWQLEPMAMPFFHISVAKRKC